MSDMNDFARWQTSYQQNGATAVAEEGPPPCLTAAEPVQLNRIVNEIISSKNQPPAEVLPAIPLNPKYFLGDPCKHGHDGRRYKKDRACVTCQQNKRRAKFRSKLPKPIRPCPEACELCGYIPQPGTHGERGMHLDHDHKTGKFRGWLCGKCNMSLGKFGDDVEGLLAAVMYLKRNTTITGIQSDKRKEYPICTGCLDYFSDAISEVAHVSYIGNQQHNPGETPYWNRDKSRDDAEALMRHFRDRGAIDADGIRHSAKVAWRALALLQKELEKAQGLPISRGSKQLELEKG